jgi:hypothetical protein
VHVVGPGLAGGGCDELGELLEDVLVAGVLGTSVTAGLVGEAAEWLAVDGVGSAIPGVVAEPAGVAGWPQPALNSAARIAAAIIAQPWRVFQLINGFPLLAEAADVRP